MEWHYILKTVDMLHKAFNLSIVCDVWSCWLLAMRSSSSSTIPLHSKCLLNWCGRSETGWTLTACCCTTPTWCSFSPTALRARTSTQRSSATACCHSMTSSKLSLTPTAYLRYWLLLCQKQIQMYIYVLYFASSAANNTVFTVKHRLKK